MENENRWINTDYDEYEEEYESDWEKINHKMVMDSDGFMTDYTMYYNEMTDQYICVFGDNELYEPSIGNADFITENKDEAFEWFDSYNGFDENEDLDDLENILIKFDENGWKGSLSCGPWRIANGGYDLWFEIYYNDQPAVQCIDGTLNSNFETGDLDTKKILNKIMKVYDHLELEKNKNSSLEGLIKNVQKENEGINKEGKQISKNIERE